MVTRPSIIVVKDAAPSRSPCNGPKTARSCPGYHYDLGTITPPGHVTSLAWTALSPDDTSISAAIRADAGARL